MSVAVAPNKIIEDPNYPGFTVWVRSAMGVPNEVLRDFAYLDQSLQMAYDTSINIAYIGLKLVKNRAPFRLLIREPPHPSHPIQPPPAPLKYQTLSVYAIAVYNLGGHFLCEIAVDDPTLPPPFNTFWADLRQKLGLNTFNYGLLTSGGDQGTSAGQQIPDQIAGMSLLGLNLLQTPWGRMYVMLAGQWGTLWGIS